MFLILVYRHPARSLSQLQKTAPATGTQSATTSPATGTIVTDIIETAGAALPVNIAERSKGIDAPGIEDLNDLRIQFPDAPHLLLDQGHQIYTGVCTNCHRAKNIYERPVER